MSPLLWRLTLPSSTTLYWFRLEKINNFDLKSRLNVLENRLCLSTQENIFLQQPEELMKPSGMWALLQGSPTTSFPPAIHIPQLPPQHVIPRQLSSSLSTVWASGVAVPVCTLVWKSQLGVQHLMQEALGCATHGVLVKMLRKSYCGGWMLQNLNFRHALTTA